MIESHGTDFEYMILLFIKAVGLDIDHGITVWLFFFLAFPVPIRMITNKYLQKYTFFDTKPKRKAFF